MTETIFKVGDEVEVIRGSHKGHIGTITEHRGDKAIWPWNVKYPADSYGGIGFGIFNDSELKLVKPAPKFKKGDIVKSVGFQYMLFEGKTLIVHGPSTGKGYDYQVRALGEDYKPGHDFREDELVAGEPLAQWEIELIDYRPGKKALVDYAVADVKATTSLFKDAKGEAVKHPAHYGGGDNPYEAIKVIEAWGLGFNLGNAAKYLARAGKKGNKVEDLNKLIQYVQFEIAKEEAK